MGYRPFFVQASLPGSRLIRGGDKIQEACAALSSEKVEI